MEHRLRDGVDVGLQHGQSFIGATVDQLPTPALILSKSVLEKNIEQTLKDVANRGVSFRPHVKTLKSTEVTRMMLGHGISGHGTHRRVVASTLCEIDGLRPLVREGLLDEVLYGIPVYPGAYARLHQMRSTGMNISVMVDSVEGAMSLDEWTQRIRSHGSVTTTWDVFVKLDVGSRRAGVPTHSAALQALVKYIDTAATLRLHGFYCHAGQSYSVKTAEQAADMLKLEVDSVVEASRLIDTSSDRLILSVGATPTARVVATLQYSIPDYLELELHAGNFCVNDLQQISTGLVTEDQLALRVAAEVCSVYNERNEALINAGVIALTREPSAACSGGHGLLVNLPAWQVVRVSQEHGIVGLAESKDGTSPVERVEDVFKVGQRVMVSPQHACITASNFHVYFVVDERDVVVDTWVPWKGW